MTWKWHRSFPKKEEGSSIGYYEVNDGRCSGEESRFYLDVGVSLLDVVVVEDSIEPVAVTVDGFH